MNSPVSTVFGRPLRGCALRLAFALALAAALPAATAELLSGPSPGPGPDVRLSLLHPQGATTWDPTDALAVQVELRHPAFADEDASSEPFIVAPATVPWPETVSLRVRAADGGLVTWPFLRSGTATPGPVTLTIGGSPSMLFVLGTDPGRRLPPGPVSLVAVLEVRDGTGWTGLRESPPLSLVVGPSPSTAGGSLEVEVTGGSVLAVGDPWVVALRLLPPLGTGSEAVLRSGYRIRVLDEGGREIPSAFEPAVTLPRFPGLAELTETGLYPVLAVLPPSAATHLQAGRYRLEASWSGPTPGAGRTQSVDVAVSPVASVEGNPERARAVQQQQLRWATALLWRAEYGSTAEIDLLTRQAAPLLLEVEAAARGAFLAEPPGPETALALSETYFLSGDFEGAEAFASLARGLQFSRVDPDSQGLDSDLEDIAAFRQTIAEAAARPPGRVLPYLLPAIQAARPPEVSAQWAVSARASTEYRPTDYGAGQATGAPNVTRHGDNARAWASKLADAGEEWLELTYGPAVRASGVRIIQSFNPGAVIRIEVLSESGSASTVWTGPDRTVYPRGEIGVLEVSFPVTPQPVARVKVVLDTKLVAGWNEIDAVQLLAAPTPAGPPRLGYRVTSGNPRVLEFSLLPAGFSLQRATSLSPPDWADLTNANPVRFELGSESAFFRLREEP